jgi:uncharacterized membrane protein
MAPVPTPGFAPPAAPAYVNLNTPKVVGGLGCIFLLLFFLPGMGGLLGILGLAFVGFALKRIADTVHEPKIFANYLYALLASVVGIVVGVLVVVAAFLRLIGLENIANNDWAGWTPTAGQALGLGLALLGGLAIMWGALILSAVFVRRAGDLVADRLNIPMFRTAGLVYLVGAALSVVLIGFLVIAIALLLFAVGFFTIPDRPALLPYPPPAGGAR